MVSRKVISDEMWAAIGPLLPIAGDEPLDHAIGRARGGLTTKNHLVCDGKGRALAFILTPGQAADTSMLAPR